MRSRRDQVQAYLFEAGRLIGALMKGRPEGDDPPHRRFTIGTAVGLLLTVLIAAGFGIYGLLRPGGSDQWRRPGSIIVVKETGARYLLLGSELRPVLNYTSAALILQSTAPVRSVSRNSLTGVPIGAPVGIPDAPDAVPTGKQLYRGAWTVCARRPLDRTRTERTTLVLDDVAGRDPGALLVSTPDNGLHLVWQGRRYRLAGDQSRVALGYGGVPPVRVTEAWLNPIDSGRDLVVPVIAGRGRAGPTVAGVPSVVGQIFEVANPVLATRELYLARTDGFAPVSRTVGALLLGDPASRRSYPGSAPRPILVDADAMQAAPMVGGGEYVTGFPAEPPPQINDLRAAVPCVRHSIASGSVRSEALAVSGAALDRAVTVPTAAGTAGLADEVVLRTGSGMLLRDRPAPGAVPTGVYLVSEFGVKFPLPDDKTTESLGYAGVSPTDVPREFLALLPSGPALDRDAALTGRTWGR
ncbi:type VII secretion protein EccB [Micromonospora sp. WMMD1120]|uniref:type VII secretion protein EccB n=1 Tax=Micromonospora sp. WMMD1120 TaxID=3016106 RepID=UPI0024164864|nr:type VII secretion protein EccB [Micromonospora sp. WMMD1120]MDG4809480.1 type VII secretion protein EccB [Micromonospora sp. WMMD1120]